MNNKYKIDIEMHSKIDDFLTKRASNVNLNTIKSELTDAIVLCCAIDMRSFNIIEGEGFQILAQKLVDIGAQYGSKKSIIYFRCHIMFPIDSQKHMIALKINCLK
jgi:hypothetical protein